MEEMAKKAKAAAGPVSAEPSQDAPASEGDAEPAGGEGEEGEQDGSAEADPWPPVKGEEQTWEEYLGEYRTKCPAAEMIVKR